MPCLVAIVDCNSCKGEFQQPNTDVSVEDPLQPPLDLERELYKQRNRARVIRSTYNTPHTVFTPFQLSNSTSASLIASSAITATHAILLLSRNRESLKRIGTFGVFWYYSFYEQTSSTQVMQGKKKIET